MAKEPLEPNSAALIPEMSSLHESSTPTNQFPTQSVIIPSGKSRCSPINQFIPTSEKSLLEMSDGKLVNIARPMTTYNFEIEQLPDDLKCAQCTLVLKDACQLPCGCRFCRTCIDDMMARGSEFCPGDSEDCGQSPLSSFSLDYRANKSVSRLAVKCPHDGCVHACRLDNMDQHLRQCPRKSEDCPFRELGCTQDKVAAEEIRDHLQHEDRRHIKILIEVIRNINKEIETMKRQLVWKDWQLDEIFHRLIHIENETKSMAREKADLVDQVRRLSERIGEGSESDELDSCSRVTQLVDRKIEALRVEIRSSVEGFQSINHGADSIKEYIYGLKSQLQSIQAVVQIDARCDWQIDEDIRRVRWGCGRRASGYFTGLDYPYKYQLATCNDVATDSLSIYLSIYRGESDRRQLPWPFKGGVIITVADRHKRELCRSISLYCRITKPPVGDWRWSERFDFPHSELKLAGLKLRHGVSVSCVIVPSLGQKG